MPKSMARAPTTAPQRNTKAKVSAPITLGFQSNLAGAGLDGLALISRQRDQHPILRCRRIERRRVLLRHYRFGGRLARIAGLPRDQIGPEEIGRASCRERV